MSLDFFRCLTFSCGYGQDWSQVFEGLWLNFRRYFEQVDSMFLMLRGLNSNCCVLLLKVTRLLFASSSYLWRLQPTLS